MEKMAKSSQNRSEQNEQGEFISSISKYLNMLNSQKQRDSHQQSAQNNFNLNLNESVEEEEEEENETDVGAYEEMALQLEETLEKNEYLEDKVQRRNAKIDEMKGII